MSQSVHRPIHAANLPKPVGPGYSPGMGFERLVFVSGEGATDPGRPGSSPATPPPRRPAAPKNVQAILQAAGTDLQHVLRCGVFLVDMDDFQEMNAVYERMFAGHKPARTTIRWRSCRARGCGWESTVSRTFPRSRG